MQFQQLVSFLAIAEEHNFGRAARRLHLAQSSVSLQLKRLEREVGAQLVARSSHQVSLTPAGEVFLDEARQVLELADHAVAVARAVADGRAGSLRVGFNFAAGRLVLPPALTRLHAEHPDLRVHLGEKRSGPQLRALADGELDVALVFGAPTAAGLAAVPVCRVDLVALVTDTHRWARRDKIGFRELAGQPCVLFGREQCPAMYDELRAIAGRTGTELDVVAEIDDPLATAVTVHARQVVGFASAPRWHQTGPAGLVTVPIVDPVPSLVIHAAWRRDDDSLPVRSFLQCLGRGADHSSAASGRGRADYADLSTVRPLGVARPAVPGPRSGRPLVEARPARRSE
ncbi:LysR family transcriptional regulator [Actinokineospora enzanensis]|uniref:LysR substrate-binding domain-containing protein n=1 Tax=Actinokineospora enzanensis TaxID=155975 RepID=UPI00038223AE|nr:LysR family transcriptional regulator [Actinokineospora enzanensis]